MRVALDVGEGGRGLWRKKNENLRGKNKINKKN